MISESLELCVDGGRVSHCWCMCVVGHGYGGLGGAGMEAVGMDARDGWSHDGRHRSTSLVRVDILMATDHTAVQVRSSG